MSRRAFENLYLALFAIWLAFGVVYIMAELDRRYELEDRV